MAPIPNRKTERAPPIDKLLKPAVVAVAAMMAYVIMQGLKSEIPRVDMDDSLAMREVFFGEGDGKNYIALCHTPATKGGQELPLSSVFIEASTEGSVKGEFVLVDCAHKLESGKTVAERFDLDLTKRPTIFVSGKVGSPKQIPSKHLKTGAMLVKALRGQLEPRAAKIENTKQLKQDCLNKDNCILMLKGGTPEKYVVNGFKELMADFPQVSFASMDANALLLTNMESTNLPLEFSKGQHRMVFFKKISGGLEAPGKKNDTKPEDDEKDESDNVNQKDDKKKSTGRLISSAVGYTGKSFHQPPLSNFIQDALNGKYKFTKLSSLPAIKTRSKKNEAAEIKKRERYLAQQERKRQQEEQSSSEKPQGAFSASSSNSGEDRKAQRDRLREEHRKKMNYTELTPEQKAEKERLRRERMAEEAANWNIQSEEDYLPEGEPIGDGEDEPLEWDESEDVSSGDADEDSDDVLDLD